MQLEGASLAAVEPMLGQVAALEIEGAQILRDREVDDAERALDVEERPAGAGGGGADGERQGSVLRLAPEAARGPGLGQGGQKNRKRQGDWAAHRPLPSGPPRL